MMMKGDYLRQIVLMGYGYGCLYFVQLNNSVLSDTFEDGAMFRYRRQTWTLRLFHAQYYFHTGLQSDLVRHKIVRSWRC